VSHFPIYSLGFRWESGSDSAVGSQLPIGAQGHEDLGGFFNQQYAVLLQKHQPSDFYFSPRDALGTLMRLKGHY
jgi:hypothetical protein